MFKKNTPVRIPATKPTSPRIALRSPPARRTIILNGHPRNIKHPIITKKPSAKRVIGELPPLGAYSFLISAIIKLPRTIPIISGLMYWTTAALWSPNAPLVSRKKHAIQNPMFEGFPNSTNNDAITPITKPDTIILIFSFFISKTPLLYIFTS